MTIFSQQKKSKNWKALTRPEKSKGRVRGVLIKIPQTRDYLGPEQKYGIFGVRV